MVKGFGVWGLGLGSLRVYLFLFEDLGPKLDWGHVGQQHNFIFKARNLRLSMLELAKSLKTLTLTLNLNTLNLELNAQSLKL